MTKRQAIRILKDLVKDTSWSVDEGYWHSYNSISETSHYSETKRVWIGPPIRKFFYVKGKTPIDWDTAVTPALIAYRLAKEKEAKRKKVRDDSVAEA